MSDDVEQRLEQVARATRLREGGPGVRMVLEAVHRHGPAPLAEIARAARLPLPVATAVRRELERDGLLHRAGGVALTEAGQRFVVDDLGIVAVAPAVETPAEEGGPSSVLAALTALMPDAPPTDVTLDQAPCTPETAVKRAIHMENAGALQGRRILILGDDDSVSLALALHHRAIGAGDMRHPIVVLELDEQRAAFIEASAKRYDLAIEVIRHDLRDPLPDGLLRKFDVIETDPPYTVSGAQLFLRRGASALRQGPGRMGFFSYAQVSGAEQQALVRMIVAERFAPVEIIPQFNEYIGASVLGGVGQFMALTTGTDSPPPNVRYDDAIYTAECRPRRRAYVCKNCGAAHTLGEDGTPNTIEALKARGCTRCSETVFRRLPGK